MVRTTTCPLCEASCGILVDTEGEHIRSIRRDQNDPFSLGYVCPKATALADLHNDPDCVAESTAALVAQAFRLR
jgi:anaerobic selenocysteine-containing dehydrogenase